MTVEYEKLVVLMEASVAKFDKDIQNIGKTVETAMRSVEGSTTRATSTVERNIDLMVSKLTGIRGALTPIGAAAAAISAIRFGENIIQNIDEITKKARDMRIAFDEDAAQSIRNFKDKWERYWIEIKAAALPTIASTITDLENLDAVTQRISKNLQAAIDAVRKRASGDPSVTIPIDPTVRQRAAGVGIPFATNPAEQQLEFDRKRAALVGQEATAYTELITKMNIAAASEKATVDQREIDLKLIEAANAALADQAKIRSQAGLQALPKTIVSSAEQARGILGPAQSAALEEQVRKIWAAGARRGLLDTLQDARASAAHPSEIPIQGLLTREEAGADAARIIDKTRAVDRLGQSQQEYLDKLREEARIAGLMPKLREEENELLRVKAQFGKDFAEQSEDEIRATIRKKQANEELVQVQEAAASEIANFGDIMEQAGGKFGKAVELMILDLAKLMLKMEATKALSSALHDIDTASGGAGFFGSVMKLIGLRAEGGPVSSGSPYVVGEQGPEIFVPTVSGTIIPNSQLSTTTSRGDMNFQIVVNGARGNSEIRDMVSAGVQQGIAVYDRQALPARVARLNADPRAR